MAVDSAATKRQGGFRRWRRSRPFWGGLFLILSGLELLGSGNLELDNIQIHLGVEGFLSYIVPAFVILCGVLTWVSPSQRLFYGILGTLAALYSLISVNLGGFFLGMILGVIGGALTVAWVPIKRTEALIPAPRMPDDDSGPDTAELETADVSTAGLSSAESETGDDSGPEGKQGARFPRPRHASPDDDTRELTRTATESAITRRLPRTAFAVIAALVLATAVSVATLHNPVPASAATCTPASLSQIIKRARSTKSATHVKHSRSAVGDGMLAGAHDRGDDGGIVGGLLAGLGKLLTGPSASPSATPTPPAKPTPTANPTPTGKPTPTEPATPSPSKSPTPTAAPSKSPAPSASPTTKPTVTPSPSISCAVVAKRLAAAASQATVEETPAIQTVGRLSMTGLSYDGNVNLPTKSGTISVMEFSMDSSTSTPFELDITLKGHTTRVKSSSLTVSGNVKFYATELKGNALGLLPVDYTPASPPPITPPVIFFTDVTIGLVDVQCDALTAANFTIA